MWWCSALCQNDAASFWGTSSGIYHLWQSSLRLRRHQIFSTILHGRLPLLYDRRSDAVRLYYAVPSIQHVMGQQPAWKMT